MRGAVARAADDVGVLFRPKALPHFLVQYYFLADNTLLLNRTQGTTLASLRPIGLQALPGSELSKIHEPLWLHITRQAMTANIMHHRLLSNHSQLAADWYVAFSRHQYLRSGCITCSISTCKDRGLALVVSHTELAGRWCSAKRRGGA